MFVRDIIILRHTVANSIAVYQNQSSCPLADKDIEHDAVLEEYERLVRCLIDTEHWMKYGPIVEEINRSLQNAAPRLREQAIRNVRAGLAKKSSDLSLQADGNKLGGSLGVFQPPKLSFHPNMPPDGLGSWFPVEQGVPQLSLASPPNSETTFQPGLIFNPVDSQNDMVNWPDDLSVSLDSGGKEIPRLDGTAPQSQGGNWVQKSF
jgi:hypothetical protein